MTVNFLVASCDQTTYLLLMIVPAILLCFLLMRSRSFGPSFSCDHAPFLASSNEGSSTRQGKARSIEGNRIRTRQKDLLLGEQTGGLEQH